MLIVTCVCMTQYLVIIRFFRTFVKYAVEYYNVFWSLCNIEGSEGRISTELRLEREEKERWDWMG